eukprot:COSAG04_NODE_13412_length_607_cov_0.911417_1_plen_187_part_10
MVSAQRGGNVDTGVSRLHAVCRPQMLNYASRPAEEGGQGERRRHVSAEDNPPLPITEDYYRCELGDFEAGSYNVSVQLPQGLAWASPEDAGLYSRDSAGTKYQVQYYPTVSGISPAQGSLGGGTTVTISGRGFSTDEHDVMIDLGSTQVRMDTRACKRRVSPGCVAHAGGARCCSARCRAARWRRSS